MPEPEPQQKAEARDKDGRHGGKQEVEGQPFQDVTVADHQREGRQYHQRDQQQKEIDPEEAAEQLPGASRALPR